MRRDADPTRGSSRTWAPSRSSRSQGDGVYEIPVGPDPRRAHRTGPLPVLGRRRDHPADEGPAVVPAPRRREAVRGTRARPTGSSWPSGSAATPPSGHASPTSMAVEDAAGIEVDRAATRLARALLLELERLHNHVADLGAIANDVGYGIANAHAAAAPRDAAAAQHERRPGTGCCAAAITIGGARLRRAARPRHCWRPSPREVAELVRASRWPTRGARPVHRHRGPRPGAGDSSSAPSGYVARASGVDDRRPARPPVRSTWATASRSWSRHAGDVLARFLVRVREVARLGAASIAGPGGAARRHAPGEAAPSTRSQAGSRARAWSRAGAGRCATASSSTRPAR